MYCEIYKEKHCIGCPEYDKDFCEGVKKEMRAYAKENRHKTHDHRHYMTQKHIFKYVTLSKLPELTSNQILDKIRSNDKRIVTNIFYVNEVMKQYFKWKKIKGKINYFAKFKSSEDDDNQINEERDEKMKIKIKNDPKNVIEQIFQDEPFGKYHYVESDILIYLIYGEEVKWDYDHKKDRFYIHRGSDLLDDLSHEEWCRIFKENKISIDKSKNQINILASENVANNFIKFLNYYDVEYQEKIKLTVNLRSKNDEFDGIDELKPSVK